MKLKRAIYILLVFLVLPIAAYAADGPIKGKFERVPGQQYKFDGKTIEVVEFMSFYCGGCYEFEDFVPVIKGNFPKKIKWKYMPVYWGKGSSKPGEAFLLAEEAGKGEQMKKAIFKAYFVDKKDIGDAAVLEALAAEAGLGFDFSRKLRAGDKAKEAQKAIEMANAYKIQETPTVVVAGNLMMNAHMFNHDFGALKDNVITVMKSIMTQAK